MKQLPILAIAGLFVAAGCGGLALSATSNPNAIAVDGMNLYWASQGYDNVRIGRTADGTVMRATLDWWGAHDQFTRIERFTCSIRAFMLRL
jgi:hypothetical protein